LPILPSNVHEAISADLASEWAKLSNPTKDQIWAIYQKVYRRYPDWLAAIERYF